MRTGFITTLLFGACLLAGTASSWSEGVPGGTQTTEGGRGMVFMESARTFGQAAFTIGGQALYQRREYPVYWKKEYNTDNTTIGIIPATLGFTDWLDLTAAVYGFHDARPYVGYLKYGLADYGVGAVRTGIKLRYPFAMDYPIQLGVKLGAMLDTSEKQMDGMIYRWTRKGTDYEWSALQTFDLGSKVSLHLEEGFVKSGSVIYANQWVGAVGLEYRANDRLTFGLEANNRTFDGPSPQSVFKAGMNPACYYGGTLTAGDPYYLKEKTSDRMEDFFIVVPSVSWQMSEKVALNLGVAINVADQEDPKETFQIAAGLNYGTIIPWLGDSDHDGVRNNRDREKNTPKGYPVDTYGVSLDTDKDGVPDGRDQEKNTPRGAKVNAQGVGIDTDGDRVYDGIDKEVNTPAGYPVDRDGVALDDDRDGVPNGRDRELNTPAGKPVDQYGVQLKEREAALVQQGSIRLDKVFFAVGKSVIKPESYGTLNEAIEILQKYPNLKIEVQGHTDITGSRAKNISLSQARAQAVLDYLIKNGPGLNRANFTAVGYGPDKPIASNATAEGKQANRRVEFVVLNKEELQRRR